MVDIPDVINGCFEGFGSLFLMMNVIKLYKEKELKGVSWVPTVFMSSWGVYNLYYYKHLNQPLSWYGGMAIVLVNTVWLGMIYYYYRQKKNAVIPLDLLLSNDDVNERYGEAIAKIDKLIAKAPKESVRRGGLINHSIGRGFRRIFR